MTVQPSGDVLGDAIFALLDENKQELGATAIYVMGDVPEDAIFPYLTYHKRSVMDQRISIGYAIFRRQVQIDVLSGSVGEAEAMADAIESLVPGTSVAVSETSTPFPDGFQRVEGAWRINDYPEPLVDGDAIYRVVLLFEQREAATL